jgi:hypothetical protein
MIGSRGRRTRHIVDCTMIVPARQFARSHLPAAPSTSNWSSRLREASDDGHPSVDEQYLPSEVGRVVGDQEGDD